MIFFTSDTHFGHANIIRYTGRPFKDVDEMDKTLINNWNSIVTDKDIVYHLGDFSFGPATKYMKELNGTKYFVRGNHEKPLLNLINVKDVPYIRHLNIDSHPEIVICHYSMRVWSKSHFGSFHLFGHSHGRLEPYKKSVDVGVDSHWITGKQEFRPFSCEEVCAFLEKREGEKLDNGEEIQDV
jgi:calcineurin-like phosphoesterase family protein